MANWSKHIEDITGLPVFKRAKHGIHFQRPDGQIEASFSGKPCHHFADGIWKPIDTKLLPLGDGFYGCPHSPVKVHPDGRVAVTGTSYQQRAELPSAKTGLADNDKLIRQFSFGSQELRITEDGFKSEITLNRIPTLTEARKLIASESGRLSKKYLKSLTTATDANGDVHVVTTLAAFRTWLAKAVFPVVIDPDFVNGHTNYGDTILISGGSPNYNERRNYGANTGAAPGIPGSYGQIFITRFDLSSISPSYVCGAVSYKVTKLNTSVNTRKFKIYSLASGNADWVEGTGIGTAVALAGEPCWTARKADGSGGVTEAWAGSAGCSTSGTDYESTVLMEKAQDLTDEIGTQLVFDFNASGIARVEDWFGAITNNYGFIFGVTNFPDLQIATSDYSTESYRPVLTVTYTAGGIAIPVAQYYYNRLRRN